MNTSSIRELPIVRLGGTHISSDKVRQAALSSKDEYTLLCTSSLEIRFVRDAVHRMVQVAQYSGASMVYADRFLEKDGAAVPAPLIDYQEGSLRDDFNFGALCLVRTSDFRKAAQEMQSSYRYAGLYELRLHLSGIGKIVHIPEFLYYEVLSDSRATGEKLFDYVNPRNREVQIEMEQACTEHLKAVGAYLPEVTREIDPSEGEFEYEASVVIPCRNRAATIADAIRSALSQKTSFKYNVIVVDDNSTDGTREIITGFLPDDKLVYIAQPQGYNVIGGNWNAAVHHPKCGRFALQLDSDDVYSGEDTVQKFVEAFREHKSAMVIGSYRITDFDLNTLPPGVIDHREWTSRNGHNNALRVNGLGAPRGFFTPVLREIDFPVTKYGEDYAVALRICREYKIARIWDVLYDCRRWGGNSDSSLPLEVENGYNLYKDRLRTWELQARRALNLKR